MLKIGENCCNCNFEILAKDDEKIVLIPADDGVTIEEFAIGVLEPFITNNIPEKGSINNFFTDLLVGRAENATLKGITFRETGIELAYDVFRISKSGSIIVGKRYKNTLSYKDTGYFSMNVIVVPSGKKTSEESYLVVFLGEDFTLFDNKREKAYSAIIAA